MCPRRVRPTLPAYEEAIPVSADKAQSWAYTEEFIAEDEALALARARAECSWTTSSQVGGTQARGPGD